MSGHATDSGMTRWLLWCGVLGPPIFVGGFIILGQARPGYNAWYTFASQLALDGGGPVWQTVNCLAGLLIVAFGVGLRKTVRAGVGSRGWVAVGLGGLGILFFGLSHDDAWLLYPPPNTDPWIDLPVTLGGWGHQAGALAAFLGLESAHLVFARRFAVKGDGTLYWYSVLTAIAFPVLYVAALASGLASGRPGPLGGYAGVLQKTSIAVSLVWVAWLAWYCLSNKADDETA
jgi:hypothetical protein